MPRLLGPPDPPLPCHILPSLPLSASVIVRLEGGTPGCLSHARSKGWPEKPPVFGVRRWDLEHKYNVSDETGNKEGRSRKLDGRWQNAGDNPHHHASFLAQSGFSERHACPGQNRCGPPAARSRKNRSWVILIRSPRDDVGCCSSSAGELHSCYSKRGGLPAREAPLVPANPIQLGEAIPKG